MANFPGKFHRKTIGEKWPMLWEFSGQILPESGLFCTDLTNVFNKTKDGNFAIFGGT